MAKDVEVFKISAIITNANQGEGLPSQASLAKKLFFLFRHVWKKVLLGERKRADFTGYESAYWGSGSQGPVAFRWRNPSLPTCWGNESLNLDFWSSAADSQSQQEQKTKIYKYKNIYQQKHNLPLLVVFLMIILLLSLNNPYTESITFHPRTLSHTYKALSCRLRDKTIHSAWSDYNNCVRCQGLWGYRTYSTTEWYLSVQEV